MPIITSVESTPASRIYAKSHQTSYGIFNFTTIRRFAPPSPPSWFGNNRSLGFIAFHSMDRQLRPLLPADSSSSASNQSATTLSATGGSPSVRPKRSLVIVACEECRRKKTKAWHIHISRHSANLLSAMAKDRHAGGVQATVLIVSTKLRKLLYLVFRR
jgi:hypothetical protein